MKATNTTKNLSGIDRDKAMITKVEFVTSPPPDAYKRIRIIDGKEVETIVHRTKV